MVSFFLLLTVPKTFPYYCKSCCWSGCSWPTVYRALRVYLVSSTLRTACCNCSPFYGVDDRPLFQSSATNSYAIVAHAPAYWNSALGHCEATQRKDIRVTKWPFHWGYRHSRHFRHRELFKGWLRSLRAWKGSTGLTWLGFYGRGLAYRLSGNKFW